MPTKIRPTNLHPDTETRIQTLSQAVSLPLTGGTLTGNVNFGDNDKAQFGAGNDLQIYHDGSDSYIKEDGTGNLIVAADDFRVTNVAVTETMIAADTDSNVRLYFNNSQKLATTSTGIDVTGTVTADGLTSSQLIESSKTSSNYGAVAEFNAQTSNVKLRIDDLSNNSATERLYITHNTNRDSGTQTADDATLGVSSIKFSDGSITMNTISSGNNVDKSRLNIADNGDISFYEDTGTTPKFFWDASEERLGLGTSGPASSLHIQSSTPILRLTDSDTGASHELSGQSGAGNLNIKVDTGGTSGSPVFNISMQDSNKVSVLNNGNVGIGTTSPTGKFQVDGGRSYFSSNSDKFALYLRYNTSTGGVFVGSPATDTFTVSRSGGQEHFRIDSSGNVGIGTTSPSQKLDVNGTIVASTIASQGARIERNGSTGGANFDSVLSSGSLHFRTGTTERVRIDSSGNVGIGTGAASPASKLHLYEVNAGPVQIFENSSADTTLNDELGVIQFKGNDGTPSADGVRAFISGTVQNTSGGTQLRFGTANSLLPVTDRMIIRADGNVGIGTSVPYNLLTLENGDFQIHETGSSDPLITLSVGNTQASPTQSWGFRIDNSDSDKFQIRDLTGANTVITANTSGNVGIGTSSPSEKLHVNGNIQIAQDDVFYFDTTSNRSYINRSNAGFNIRPSNGLPLRFNTINGSEAMRIDSSGNVGIGTSSPLSLLDIAVEASDTRRFLVNYDDNIITVKGSNQNSNPESLRIVADNFRVSTGTTGSGTERMRIHSGGQLSLATTDATHGFNVGQSGSDFRGRFQGSNQYRLGLQNGVNDLVWLGSGGANNFRISNSGGQTRFEIDSSGIVTIPLQPAFSARPSAKLTNITPNTSVDLNFATEIFDRNADYNAGGSPSTFTAPVTGVYQLNLLAYIENLQVGSTYFQIAIITSNRNYPLVVDPNFSTNLQYYDMTISVLADMDAGDTAYVQAYQSGGTAATDIDTASYFSGYLVA